MQTTVLCHFISSDVNRPITLQAPTSCPWCKTGFNGLAVSASCESYPDALVGVIHLCPVCSKMFFATYRRTNFIDSKNMRSEMYFFQDVLPSNPFQSIEFSKRIQEVSPQFSIIYNQAAQAENERLLEICGLGYRKSIEFLVKDYAARNNPNDIATIQAMPLSQCISKYISSKNVQTVASRVVWLGNDHAHYIVKHTDKDLDDLKALVSLTVKWIDMELETEEVLAIQPVK